MATYDDMSPAERKRLMNGLEALTGLQEGPKNALPDGTRYEYDPILKELWKSPRQASDFR
jgi:hypothetical protein